MGGNCKGYCDSCVRTILSSCGPRFWCEWSLGLLCNRLKIVRHLGCYFVVAFFG